MTLYNVALQAINKGVPDAGKTRSLLCDLELKLKPGEFVGITGPSGSGKSTLLNIIAAIEYPDQGRVVINGEELRPGQESRNTIIRRRQIGIVFQFFNLVPTLTVLENLQLPLLLNSIHNDHQQAAQMLDRFGMSGFSSALPVHLSGGEQQRVSVARALIHQPSVVLADEPTGSLDQNSGLQVLEMLREAANQGCTVCMVTHSKLAANKSDYCLQLKDGKLSQV